jgi:hypothetical protein
MRFILVCLLLVLPGSDLAAWGFFAHRKINRHAVFSLPVEMIGFFKTHIGYLTDNAVNPDRRRYAVLGEAEKHYLDADAYGDSAVFWLPRYWNQALEMFPEEKLRKYGTGPWNVYHTKLQLTEAFKRKDTKAILRLAADLGHYIADINVPLHTTVNYNGQLTGQHGIHAFWESRIPELLSDEYDLFAGKALYLEKPQLTAWDAVIGAHLALDSVLRFEKILNSRFQEDKKFTYEQRGNVNTLVQSRAYTIAYQEMLGGQVERQMKKAIRMIADFWYTAWVDAGQPDLNSLLTQPLEYPEEIIPPNTLDVREHEGLANVENIDYRKALLKEFWRGGLN